MPKHVRVEVVTRFIARWSMGDIMSDAHMGKADAHGLSTNMVVAEDLEGLMRNVHEASADIEFLASDAVHGFAYKADYLVYKGKMYQVAGSQKPVFSDQTDNKCIAWDLLLKEIKARIKGETI